MKIRNYRINSFRRELLEAVIAENIIFPNHILPYMINEKIDGFKVKNKETGQEYTVYAVGFLIMADYK